MEYRNLGKSGLKVSALSYGSWLTFGDPSHAKKMMQYAYDQGVNFFDNAEAYAKGISEEVMGKALHELKFSRDTYCVSSKAYWGGDKPTQRGLSRKHLTDACHAALKRLKLDYLDLFFCHRPDQHTPIEETVWTMHNLIEQGKILYWGTSEWDAAEIAMAHAFARQNKLIPPTMEQPEYNMFERQKLERDYVRIFKELGLGTTVWSPLASGLLTGKYNKGVPKDSRGATGGTHGLDRRLHSEDIKNYFDKINALKPIAKEIGSSLPQLALSWCLRNPNVSTVILGASKMNQLEENIKSIDLYTKLDDVAMTKIDDILGNKPEPIREF